MAQGGPQNAFLNDLRRQVAQNPINSEARLNLAYTLMLSELPDEALTHYRLVLAQDSLNQAAAAGILWSLNTGRHWDESLKEAKRLVKTFPACAPLYSYRGFAQSQKGRMHHARHSYNKAVVLAQDNLVKGYAFQGLAWSHHFLGDYPASMKSLRQAQLLGCPDSLAAEAFNRTELKLSIGSAWDFDQTLSYNASLGASWRRLDLSAMAEEVRLEQESYRQAYQIGLGYKINPLAINLRYSYLEGEEQRAYPAKSYGLGLESSIYVGAFRIKPAIRQDLGNYVRFNTYQSSVGLQLSTDALSLGAWLSYLYQDNESVGSDRKDYISQFSFHYQLSRFLNLGLYYNQGDQSWWMSPGGILNDSFYAVEKSLAISSKLNLSRIMALNIYYQKGWMDEESKDLLSLSLSAAL